MYVLYYLLWWGLESAADSPSELCRECADAADTELPYPDAWNVWKNRINEQILQ